MKRTIIILALLLLIVGCSPEQVVKSTIQDEVSEAARTTARQAASAAVEQADKAAQDLVNFECTVAGMQTFYFLKNKAKIVSAGRESWLTEDGSYVQQEVNGKTYLVKFPPTQSEMSFSSMMKMYEYSKHDKNYDCKLNTVTEDMVKLPDYEVITNEEMAQMALQGMGNIGLN
ncbi:hypothetical protein D6777_04310 [Candidatus Woesearchaeota archaeon]|nr:MAG: hypothetical protein D6777_04310 [Candidatus Woesearchaeota archaeon]